MSTVGDKKTTARAMANPSGVEDIEEVSIQPAGAAAQPTMAELMATMVSLMQQMASQRQDQNGGRVRAADQEDAAGQRRPSLLKSISLKSNHVLLRGVGTNPDWSNYMAWRRDLESTIEDHQDM